MALRAVNLNENAAQPLRGQGFGAVAELALGAEFYVSAGSAAILSLTLVKTASSTERCSNGLFQHLLVLHRRPDPSKSK